MAWHILQGLLEQVRVQSTFPGKLWIVTMFIFRIVVVARIGEMVYHDEQSHFVCNTLTPGCKNVCFNRFSPISQLRYWSVMVLVVSTPSVFFFLYAMHVIRHANIKYPADEEESEKANSVPCQKYGLQYIHPPSLKRRREENMPNWGDPPLYEVTKLANEKNPKMRQRRRNNREDKGSRLESNTDNNDSTMQAVLVDYRGKYPIYADSRGRRIAYMKRPNTAERDAINGRKLKMKMLDHPELARAYWWHVFWRTVLEVVFILGQYYLYGWTVHELYECPYWPCPKTVDCFVSRPREKTCLLWLMYGLGFIACALSIAEFAALGLRGTKIAFMCFIHQESGEVRRRRLAKLESPGSKKQDPHDGHVKRLTSAVSLDSLSSDTTVSSV